LEAQDGIETLQLIYKCLSEGIKISIIFSDENMNFINGIQSCNILNDILNKKNIQKIPFYLLTSFDNKILEENEEITKVLEKPLRKTLATEILNKC